MLYRYSDVFRTMLVCLDLGLVASAWLLAYGLRFHSGLPAPLGVPPLLDYVVALAVIVPLFFGLFRSHDLYAARRMDSPLGEAMLVLRATGMGLMAMAALSFLMRNAFYSRMTLAIFGVLAPFGVIAARSTIRLALRHARRRGFNLRYALVIGSGSVAEGLVERIQGRPDAGMRLLGVVADGALGGRVCGTPVIGHYGELKTILESRRVDQVFVALSRHDSVVFEKVMAELEDAIVDVKIVPDLVHGYSLRSTLENFDGLPVVGLRETALSGWGSLTKRGFDLFASSILLVGLAPIFALIGAVVLATSGRPIFYRQRRMGHDGRVFEMLKFRSMRNDAEAEGPGWTRSDDPRRTRLGRWLRRHNLDELPQLLNVVRGDMSLVGPRPERPAFIEAFRGEIPGYMLRHKVRAGMTGWAQVHGWRGDTSIHERVEHDLYYIQQWSFWLDLRILLMTILRGNAQAAGRDPTDPQNLR